MLFALVMLVWMVQHCHRYLPHHIHHFQLLHIWNPVLVSYQLQLIFETTHLPDWHIFHRLHLGIVLEEMTCIKTEFTGF
jgi:hypothetical protein